MVQAVFSSVAKRYDIMNDLMSLGLHRLWKRKFISQLCANSPGGASLLDVAGGTGDIASMFIRRGGESAIVADLNQEMLDTGKQKHLSDKLTWVCANAESLPFQNDEFDCVTISFGLRNISNMDKALAEMYRVLKPGGKFMCMEFSNVENRTVERIYKRYSFTLLPKLGKLIANDEQAYKYLAESIAVFPNAIKVKKMIEDVGFNSVIYEKLSLGIVAIHSGRKTEPSP